MDDFLKLRNAWYNKLKDAGFEDIEVFKPNKIDPLPILKLNTNKKRNNKILGVKIKWTSLRKKLKKLMKF